MRAAGPRAKFRLVNKAASIQPGPSTIADRTGPFRVQVGLDAVPNAPSVNPLSVPVRRPIGRRTEVEISQLLAAQKPMACASTFFQYVEA